ncbi:hypothetical protein JTB14_026009 [Gonioctena quinquepunctata]|nr:hypothetical protein JTB14_026009 [Gonioctena quinquepunctata]
MDIINVSMIHLRIIDHQDLSKEKINVQREDGGRRMVGLKKTNVKQIGYLNVSNGELASTEELKEKRWSSEPLQGRYFIRAHSELD